MTLDQILGEYKSLSAQAMELRSAVRTIKRQLALGGSPNWIHRAQRALHYRLLDLLRVKEEMRAYRAVLRSVGKKLIDTE
jgi:hypothetical protein